MFPFTLKTGNTGSGRHSDRGRTLRRLIGSATLLASATLYLNGSSVSSGAAAELRYSTISAGAAGSASGGFIVNAGQVAIGRSTNASGVLHAGIIPCLPSGLPAPGDCDFDGDLDYADADIFGGCLTGPDAGPVAPGCDCSDFDGDTDADLGDFAEFQVSF